MLKDNNLKPLYLPKIIYETSCAGGTNLIPKEVKNG
jgi:hypothetical protein